MEEGTFVNGHWVAGRRLAGDETIEGDCLQLQWPKKGEAPSLQSRLSRENIQRVTLYRYR